MADELNIPTHRWYQPRNNISLPKTDFSAQTIYASGIQKIDAWINSQPWGNPVPGLFALAEPGVWYDPSDLTTLFQDAAGTTPVTAAGQPVGLVLDKSQGAVGTNGASRRNLLLWSENPTQAPWATIYSSVTVASPVLGYPMFTLTTAADVPTGNYLGRVQQSLNLNTGLHTWTNIQAANADGLIVLVVSVTSPAAVGGSSGSKPVVFNTATQQFTEQGLGTGGVYGAESLGSGLWRITLTFNVTAAGTVFFQRTVDRNSTAGVSGGRSILIGPTQLETGSTATSYQRITTDWPSTMAGNHATQSTAASRPTYGIVPRTGRRNLLVQTEALTNAAWVRTALDVSGEKLIPTAVSSVHAITQDVLDVTDRVLTVEAKADGYSFLTVGSAISTGPHATVNLSTGAVIRTAGGVVGTPSVTLLPDGYYRISVSISQASRYDYGLAVADPAGSGDPSVAWTGNGTSGILVRKPQHEAGSTATAYQRVGSAFDVTEAGVPSLSYLSFDGVDDFLVTPTITPGTDKAQVFAGVRKLSDAAFGCIAELSVSSDANAGGMAFFGANAAGFYYQTGVSPNRTFGVGSNNTIAAPASYVAAALYDREQTSVSEIQYKNNGSAASSTGLTYAGGGATGNFLAYPLYIGRRGGTTLPFNGQLYGLVVRFGANLDANTISQTETWVNSKTGAY